MSVIEDSRKLFQDIVAPDLKALSARLDAVSARIDALDRTTKDGFAITDRTVKDALSSAEHLAEARHEKLEVMMALNEKIAAARHEVLAGRLEQALSALHSHHESMMGAMQLDRRMERVEKSTTALEQSSSRELAKSA